MGYLQGSLRHVANCFYLAFGFAWWFHWVRFYPGNPIQTFGILASLVLFVCALIMAAFGRGTSSAAAAVVAVVTVGLWLLSAIASVAI
jgi:hypothetical protein